MEKLNLSTDCGFPCRMNLFCYTHDSIANEKQPSVDENFIDSRTSEIDQF